MSTPPAVIVVMGVSGAGKSVFGLALAERLGRAFLDADDLHPSANKRKMGAGIPLNDSDRLPWLDTVAEAAAEIAPAVVACSALRRAYRDRMRTIEPSIVFLELIVDRGELERRLSQRMHEFMPSSLLESQLESLESLEPDERGARLNYESETPLDEHLAAAVRQLNC